MRSPTPERDGVRSSILALGEFDEPTFDACLQSVRDWSHRPDAAFWYAGEDHRDVRQHDRTGVKLALAHERDLDLRSLAGHEDAEVQSDRHVAPFQVEHASG